MNLRGVLFASAVSAIALVGATTASRADTRYVVDGTFDDGGTVTGWFDLNQYGLLSAWDLSTTAGSTVTTGWEYLPGTSFTGGGSTSFTFNRDDTNNPYKGALQLGFSSAVSGFGAQPLLTGAGGAGWSWETAGYVSQQDEPPEPVRYLLAASTVTGVPELSTWAMLVAGFATLAVAGARRASKAAVTAA